MRIMALGIYHVTDMVLTVSFTLTTLKPRNLKYINSLSKSNPICQPNLPHETGLHFKKTSKERHYFAFLQFP